MLIMKAIQIKYLAATNHNGVRLKVWAEGNKPLIVGRKYELDVHDQAREVAEKYIAETFKGNCKLYGFGCLPNGDYVATLGA
jgi:hypothetical protein